VKALQDLAVRKTSVSELVRYVLRASMVDQQNIHGGSGTNCPMERSSSSAFSSRAFLRSGSSRRVMESETFVPLFVPSPVNVTQILLAFRDYNAILCLTYKYMLTVRCLMGVKVREKVEGSGEWWCLSTTPGSVSPGRSAPSSGKGGFKKIEREIALERFNLQEQEFRKISLSRSMRKSGWRVTLAPI
jgi:hypothetical protein